MKEELQAKRIRFFGIVQGVGFRPTVCRHALRTGIAGSVCNRGSYVEIICQGSSRQIGHFLKLIEEEPPRRALIMRREIIDIPVREDGKDFLILESQKVKGKSFISPDIALCPDCERELYDPSDRRFGHPFINCTSCGPRMTILDSLPYDRERTSMSCYPMCPSCAEEYRKSDDRRYDAQPVCCPECGPRVYLLLAPDDAGRSVVSVRKEQSAGEGPACVTNEELDRDRVLQGTAAISCVRKILSEGGIAAVKGIGGFHLCCDASSFSAVSGLRKKKGRPSKPFAVMMRDMETVSRECFFSENEKKVLTGHQKPILLLRKKEGGHLADNVAPENPKAGVMLPYSPLHRLLFDMAPDDGIPVPDMLVVTSGNAGGVPICHNDREALQELSGIADVILSHNRDIRLRADDSVMDFYRDAPYMVRRSRGYAPLPFLMPEESERTVLAVGGELKNTVTIASDGLLIMSPYIGDMTDLRTLEASRETKERFLRLLQVSPSVAVSDTHPLYNSSLLAEETGLERIRVQHHYAHILSCLAENGRSDRVIGVSYDGTGYGEDGGIWGGEILTADGHSFQRAAHMAPFYQVGGDRSAREGWRIACAMIDSLLKRENGNDADESDQETDRRSVRMSEIVHRLELCSEQEAGLLIRMKEKGFNSVISTSCGRLFDAVSAVLGIRRSSGYEGEASAALQFAAQAYEEREGELPETYIRDFLESKRQACMKSQEAASVLRTDLLFENILSERLTYLKAENLKNTDDRARAQAEKMAYIFHRGLACLTVEACREIGRKTGLGTAALSGGCFQNTLLLGFTEDGLQKSGFEVLRHHLVPPNDGGISLGQAFYGAMNPPDRK